MIRKLFPISIYEDDLEPDSNEYKKIFHEIEDKLIGHVNMSLAGSNIGNSPEFGTTEKNETFKAPSSCSNVIKTHRLFSLNEHIENHLNKYIEQNKNSPNLTKEYNLISSWLAKYSGTTTSLLAHNHMGLYSFVYYHKAPLLDGGELVLHPPNAFYNLYFSDCQNEFIKPKPGKIVLFPSFLYHSVNPFSTSNNEERISIAGEFGPSSF